MLTNDGQITDAYMRHLASMSKMEEPPCKWNHSLKQNKALFQISLSRDKRNFNSVIIFTQHHEFFILHIWTNREAGPTSTTKLFIVSIDKDLYMHIFCYKLKATRNIFPFAKYFAEESATS